MMKVKMMMKKRREAAQTERIDGPATYVSRHTRTFMLPPASGIDKCKCSWERQFYGAPFVSCIFILILFIF